MDANLLSGSKLDQIDSYWSGSEYGSSDAWGVYFSYGGVINRLKGNDYHARAVRALTLNNSTIPASQLW